MALGQLPSASNFSRPDRLAPTRPLGKLVYRGGSACIRVSEPLNHARLALPGAISDSPFSRVVRPDDPAARKPAPPIYHVLYGEDGPRRGQCRMRATAIHRTATESGADPWRARR